MLVKVCVSVSPTNAPVGFVFVVKAEVPLPMITPVKVVAPVPPLPTATVPVTFAEFPEIFPEICEAPIILFVKI